MKRFAAITGRAHRLFEYHGAPDAERVIVIMGSGAETVRATVDALGRIGKGRRLTVKLYRPFSVADFIAALPPTVRVDCRARSHEGTGRHRRAAVPGCGHGDDRRLAGAAHDAGVDWRPLRSWLEGVHSGDGQGGVRRARRARAEAPLHGRHRRRRDRFVAGGGREFEVEPAGIGARGVLRTRRGRNGRRQQELDQDHRRRDGQLGAGLFRLRLEEIRRARRFRTCVSGRRRSVRRT